MLFDEQAFVKAEGFYTHHLDFTKILMQWVNQEIMIARHHHRRHFKHQELVDFDKLVTNQLCGVGMWK